MANREITNHDEILEAVRSVEIIEELTGYHDGHFNYELELEVAAYGRNYGGKKVGPYIHLMIYEPGTEIVKQGEWGGNDFYILCEGHLDVFVNGNKVGQTQEGRSFGEMGVLAGVPRAATITVAADSRTKKGEVGAKIMRLERPALRLLRKLPKFSAFLDTTYRNYGLNLTLNEVGTRASGIFNPDMLTRLGDAARYTVYGKNAILVREGDPINRLFFIKSGWVRRVAGADFNPAVADMLTGLDAKVGVDFLGAGNCVGFDGIKGPAKWPYTLTVMSRTEVMEVAVPRLREDKQLQQAVGGVFDKFSTADDTAIPPPAKDKRIISATAKEINTGVIDGTNLLVMDMDKCVRCGNCSMACHQMHGQSRLLRRGIHIERAKKINAISTQHVLVPTVCMHCQDPECLTGCPTGAIGRLEGGMIDITPKTCIGCGDCATQCPYNAITLIPRDPAKPKGGKPPEPAPSGLFNLVSLGRFKPPEPVTATDDLVAIKCNLCSNTPLNPKGKAESKRKYSCQENCPTGALVRVNPKEYFDEAKDAMGLIYLDQTHALGRNIHKRDPLGMLWHLFGVAICILGTFLAISYGLKNGLDGLIFNGWRFSSVRWITGYIGLFGIIVVMLYPGRRQIYRRAAGALRYWMLSHVYFGALAGLLLLVHGGFKSGGLLTTFLMISFDLVIASGLFGIACYLLVPRIMTSIEGDPLLYEDLTARAKELRGELADIGRRSTNADLQGIIRKKVPSRFLSFGYLLRQYIKREPLDKLLAKAREEFQPDADKLRQTDARSARLLMEAVETTATLRRVEALIYCHQLLKMWLAPHVVSTSLMLALMLVHMIQVFYFAVWKP
jgi:Fe-S-cluster-containing dehydrogenase component/CRP-like cAMP-binding protein